MGTENYTGTGLATRCVHAGMAPDVEAKAFKHPLVMSNNYEVPPRGGLRGDDYEGQEFFRVNVGLEAP